jgi:hypothetical protein
VVQRQMSKDSFILVPLKSAPVLTLARFEEGPLRGVPSRFSGARVLASGSDSSRTGRTFRSAYFLQLVPQLSQRISVARPFGAFHQTLDSRVLQAPQAGDLDGGGLTREPSSSDRPTCCPSLASSTLEYWRLIGLGDEVRVVRWFTSPSFILYFFVQSV